MTVRAKLLLGFLSIALLLAVMGYVAVRGARQISVSFDVAANSATPAIRALLEIKSAANEIEAQTVAFQLIGPAHSREEGSATGVHKYALIGKVEKLVRWTERYERVVREGEGGARVGVARKIRRSQEDVVNEAFDIFELMEMGVVGDLLLSARDELVRAQDALREVVAEAIANELAYINGQNERASSTADAIRNANVLISALTFAIALFVGLALSRSIATPIRRLSQMVEQFGKSPRGEAAPMPVASGDEITQLSVAFSEMTIRLEMTTVSRDALADEVAERLRAENELAASRAHLLAVLDSVGEGIIAVDATGVILTVNQEGLVIFGYKSEELLGENLTILMPETYRQLHTEGLRRYAQTGEARVLGKRIELEGLRKDGTIFPLEMRFTQARTGDRQIFVGAGRDITERKRGELEISRLVRQNELILDSAGEGICGLDLNGDITFVNPAGARMAGWDVPELIGRSQHEMLHHSKPDGEPYPLVECAIHRPSRNGRTPRVADEVFWKRDGTHFPVEYVKTPILDERGALEGTVITFRDVTERRQLQRQLVQSQKMDAIGRLADGLAHDFNNILMAIISHVELAAMQLSPQHSLHEELDGIRKASDSAANLVRHLMTFSRHRVDVSKVMSLNDLVMGTEKMLRRLIWEEIELVILPSEEPDLVEADPSQLEQVLVNLVVNARDALTGGGKITIETGGATKGPDDASDQLLAPGRYATLSVRDDGVGMTAELIAQIFEPFFTTKDADKGNGIGLSTCYGVIRRYGGYIDVDSAPGRGSTFRVYLPSNSELEPEQLAPGPNGPARTLQGHETVLLAEDDPSVRALVARALRQNGYKVLEAANGTEALRLVDEHAREEIHVLVTDLVMPLMGGAELVRRFSPRYPNTKVIYTSGYVAEGAMPPEISEPSVEFLHKPYPPTDLIAKIREVLDD
jgi:PAS domain S-box-containing protein